MSETKVDHLVDGVNPSISTNLKFELSLPKRLGLSLVNQFCVRKKYRLSYSRFNNFRDILEKFIESPDKDVVKVFRYKITNEYDELVNYYYDMQRLYLLSAEEKSIVNSCETNLNTAWESKVPLIVLGRQKYPELISFMERAVGELKYYDMHAGNVMKDKTGSFRIIDLEGFLD